MKRKKKKIVIHEKTRNYGRDFLDYDSKLIHTHKKGREECCSVHSVTFSPDPDNERYFSISLKELEIWRSEDNRWRLEHVIPGAYTASFSQKGELITCALRNKSVQVWKLTKHGWNLNHTLRKISHPIKCISFLPGNDCIATVTDHHLNILDTRSGRELRSPIALGSICSGGDRPTTQMSCPPSGEYFACGTLHGSLCIWNTRGLRLRFKIATEKINTVCFSPCERQLVIAYSNKVRLYDISKVVEWASIFVCLNNITMAPLAHKIIRYVLPVPTIYDCDGIKVLLDDIYFDSNGGPLLYRLFGGLPPEKII